MKKIYFIALFWVAMSSFIYAQTATLSGTFLTAADEFLTEVEVKLINDDTEEELSSTTTNRDGFYQFPDIPTDVTYRIEANKGGSVRNGVSTFDLVLIRKHIIGTTFFDDPFDSIAADVNDSQTITTLDMVRIRGLILFNNDDFRNDLNWRFFRSTITFDNSANPFAGADNNDFTIMLTADINDFDFIGVKVGDVNDSAAP